jgi:molybdopterin converting factor small subunit
MIVKVRNINTMKSFQVEGDFTTLSDVRNAVEGTENELILGYDNKVINRTNNRERVFEDTPINTSDVVELLVQPVKVEAGY